MRWRWPWWRTQSDPDKAAAARAAKQTSEAKLRAAHRNWPEVMAARDDLARLAERAMRGTR